MSKYICHLSTLVISCVLLCAFVTSANSQQLNQPSLKSNYSDREEERERRILDGILNAPTYDRNIRPFGGNTTAGETQVTVNIAINRISRIDDFWMEYAVQLTLREEWQDDRLRFSHWDTSGGIKYLTLKDTSRIWMPDMFFLNEKSGQLHSIIKPNVFVRIYPNGRISMSIRISLTLGCNMDLQLFPMDTQNCSIIMSSYAWTTEDLMFKWKEENPVQTAELSLPRFYLEKEETFSCDDNTVTGTYSCLRVDLKLVRNFSFYLTSAYIPCILLVIVSWVSFWIDENAAPARVALGVTTLLTMATHQANMNKNLPPVSYIKALDVWSETCLTFIFAALVEYALVNYSVRYDRRTKRKIDESFRQDSIEPSGGCIIGCCCVARRNMTTSKKIDIVSRFLFPGLFIIFNIVYWSVYLTSAYH